MIWQTSNNGSTWTTQPSPSSYGVSFEDLDSNSFRAITTGNLNRNVIKRRWAKVSMQWQYITDDDVSSILSAVNKDGVYFKMLSPAFGTSDYITFQGYVSKMSAECLEGQKGWNLSFNIIQARSETWQ